MALCSCARLLFTLLNLLQMRSSRGVLAAQRQLTCATHSGNIER